MPVSQRTRERVAVLAPPLLIFALNLFVVWRLLRSEFINQLPSIEGAFISLARYIQRHWPGYDWFPLWFGGFPFTNAYQPALHYTVAAVAAIFHLSSASAYHLVTSITYSLAGVAFYYLARTLSSTRRVAFAGALFFSFFSPSLLLLPVVRQDAGGLWRARRLQAMAQYGEGPNITGLMLGMFALALLHAALTRRKPLPTLAAALAIAAVPATNWPATVALCFGIAACLLSFSWNELRWSAPRIAGIGALALALAAPFALPSTIGTTFQNANVMADAPTAGPRGWLLLALLAISVVLVRTVCLRAKVPYALRFAILHAMGLASIVLSATLLHTNLVPQPLRFHLALEIPLALGMVILAELFLRRSPRWGVPLAALAVLFCALQIWHFRQHARSLATRLEVPKTLEFEEAEWLNTHLPGQRVAVPGTVSFWLDTFGETPQLTGCCEQSLVNPLDFIAAYIMWAGFRSPQESAEYSLLWAKAWAVHAVAIGGPASREAYHAFQFPLRFRDRLPLLWSSGDDFIYRIPERAPGLARVVDARDLVRHPPQNGIDVGELRPFVAALDDPALPLVSFAWQGPNAVRIAGPLRPSQALSIAVNYHPGWHATRNGQDVPVRPDGLGLIAIEPRCDGNCVVELRWSAGPQPWLAWSLALFSLVCAMWWLWRETTAGRGNSAGGTQGL